MISHSDQYVPAAETQMNAYVLLPNALHLLLHAPKFDFDKHVGAEKSAVEAVQAELMDAKPNAMAEFLAASTQDERNILHRCLLVCLRAFDEPTFEQRLGLPKDVSGEVLQLLRDASKKSDA